MKEKSHNFRQVSAWHCSAAVTIDGVIYVWGQGIFGEFKKPRKVKLQNNILIENISVGGSFIVLVDENKRLVVWGSNHNGEIGVGDNKIRNHPTRLESIEDKVINAVSVGSNFAFAIGKTSSKVDGSVLEESALGSQISALKAPDSRMMVQEATDYVDAGNDLRVNYTKP